MLTRLLCYPPPPTTPALGPLQVTAVDKSAPTAMCVLALGGALAKQWGARLAAERVLPTLAPLLVAPALNSQQFAAAMKTVRDVLGAIERSRAAGGADGGAATAVPVANGAAAGGAGHRGGMAAAAAPADWLAATKVAPGSGGGRARAQAGTPAAPASNGGDGLLSGLQLQRPAAVAPYAAPAPRPTLGGGPMGGGSMFGGQVGASRPMGSAPLAAASLAVPTTRQSQGWAFAAAPGGGGSGAAGIRPAQPGGYGSGGASAGSSSGFASSLADPFAGLQLGGPSPAAGSNSVQWPPPAPPAASGAGAPVFDPFALGSAAPGGGAGGLQWPAPPPTQQQQQQQQRWGPPAGSGGFPGGFPGGSLI